MTFRNRTESSGGSAIGADGVATSAVDLNGYKLDLDADGDTSITADTDDQIDIEINGADCFVLTADAISAANAAGPQILNSAASTTVPTLVPNKADADTGIGWDTNKLVFIVDGTQTIDITADGAFAANAHGGGILNESTNANNPTLAPDKTDLGTGVASAGVSGLALVSNSRPMMTMVSAHTYLEYLGLKSATKTTSPLSGATVSVSDLIPAGSILWGVVGKVNTAIGGGVTSWKIGYAGDDDAFGTGLAVAQNTTVSLTDYTITTIPMLFTAATDILLTPTGANFSTGSLILTTFYMIAGTP